MKIYYTDFNSWKKFKNYDLKFLAISVTIPVYFTDEKYFKLTPSKELFFDTHKNGYDPKKFFKTYAQEISKYSKNEILNDFKQFQKDICLVGWEKYKILGECQFCVAWLLNINLNDALTFELNKNQINNDNNEFLNL